MTLNEKRSVYAAKYLEEKNEKTSERNSSGLVKQRYRGTERGGGPSIGR